MSNSSNIIVKPEHVGSFIHPVILRVDDMCELLKEFVGEDEFPSDCRAVDLLVSKVVPGQLSLIVQSDRWDRDQQPSLVSFDLKRVYGVGGQNSQTSQTSQPTNISTIPSVGNGKEDSNGS